MLPSPVRLGYRLRGRKALETHSRSRIEAGSSERLFNSIRITPINRGFMVELFINACKSRLC